MAFAFNGTGIMYYGWRPLPDGTHLRTKWVAFLFVPLIPLGSEQVVKPGEHYRWGGYSGQLMSVRSVPLDRGMVAWTYATAVGVAGLFVALWKIGSAIF